VITDFKGPLRYTTGCCYHIINVITMFMSQSHLAASTVYKIKLIWNNYHFILILIPPPTPRHLPSRSFTLSHFSTFLSNPCCLYLSRKVSWRRMAARRTSTKLLWLLQPVINYLILILMRKNKFLLFKNDWTHDAYSFKIHS